MIVCGCRYMRLQGYPSASISVLTTYNGQKALLRDVIERRCANNPLFGRPHKVRHRIFLRWQVSKSWTGYPLG